MIWAKDQIEHIRFPIRSELSIRASCEWSQTLALFPGDVQTQHFHLLLQIMHRIWKKQRFRLCVLRLSDHLSTSKTIVGHFAFMTKKVPFQQIEFCVLVLVFAEDFVAFWADVFLSLCFAGFAKPGSHHDGAAYSGE